MGAQVIRVEDPVRQGRWDILRGAPPIPPGLAMVLETSGVFNNHNVEKLGITLNLREPRGKELLLELVKVSDVVTENFAAGVMDRLGLGYDELRKVNPKLLYVSNSGFGAAGPYKTYKTFGPIVQACCGLTFSAGARDEPPAGWGYSYMDHMGAYFMAIAILSGLVERNRSGEGQWIDMSCTDAGLGLAGPELLDYTVNDRPLRREGSPDSSRTNYPAMAPHGIYPAAGDDSWLAIACRDDEDWTRLADVIGEDWAREERWATLRGRLDNADELDDRIASWTGARSRLEGQERVRAVGVPVAQVASPEDRIEDDRTTSDWGLWPWVTHPAIGQVRVDGLPVHLSRTDWSIERGAPCLGEHNDLVLGGVLGLSPQEIATLADQGVI
jgi:benzylsuccinate CoA-transferase BbsF subunit